MTEANTEKIQQFIGVTGVDEERAKFYLESSAWQLEVAISSFYEEGAFSDETVSSFPPESSQRTPDESSSLPHSQIIKPNARPKQSTKFATLHTLSNSSDEEEEGQAFYAGGSENSGQQVLGPSKKQDIVADMFKSVQEHGVEVLESGASSSVSRAFHGTGYKLGQSSTDNETVSGPAEHPQPQQVTLKLWKDGFSLNDGDLRAYTDPANREFLGSIRQGEIPQELRDNISEIHLSMEDHRMELFKQNEKRALKPFSGQGYTLGSPAPPVVGAPREEDKEVNEAHAREGVNLDSSQPVTNIQIRLADGSRLLGQFNHGHTLAEVRSFIIAARPQYETRPFSLLSIYPSQELQDSQTISEAGLLNSAIMQKLK